MHQFPDNPSPESVGSHDPAARHLRVGEILDNPVPPGKSVPVGTSVRFWTLIICLLILLALPFVIGQLRYQLVYNQLKAESDVAAQSLDEMRPRLNDFVMASRLVAKRVSPSVVSIIRPGMMGRLGQGSGVIVDPEGFIVTNFHVVTGAEAIRVRLTDGRMADATVVGADPVTDLAIIKIDLPGLVAATWGDSDELEVGDLVWAVGSPFGLEHSITFGIISGKARRSSEGVTRSPHQEYLQTDAAVNPGNSGGPLVDLQGQIVGINTAIFGDAYQGISFAIPSRIVREQYDRLRKDGWIERGYLGIEPRVVTPTVRQRLELEPGQGVYVATVSPETPAFKAGLRRGDVILKWNEHQANDPTLLS
ncbi:MAG: trypsin-like peptidase domain-containing protein, partial [Pirellulaceae bacterium]